MSMTYRPNYEVLKALTKIKAKLGFKTNSKVLDHVLFNFLNNEAHIKKIEQENNDYENQLRELKRVHVKKKSAEQQLDKLLDDIEY